MKKIIEGSRAIALTIKNIAPQVVSAYPITPQTHIVEDLALLKSQGLANFSYVRAESEFAAASIVLGASAKGVRTYSATSSQGLLLMTEVLYNISGLRLPVVMTLANRAVSAPINIWNDHQDAMAVRDAGWIMLFAENNQEAVWQHILAYKIAENLSLPVLVNVDGFILTHCYEPVDIPSATLIKKFLAPYKPKPGTFLDTKNPITMGALADPRYYQEERKKLWIDTKKSLEVIKKEYRQLQKILNIKRKAHDDGLMEYSGNPQATTIIIALGSIIGTIKSALEDNPNFGVLKIKTWRPFPSQAVYDTIKKAKNIIIIEKAISPGNLGPLYLDVKSVANDKQNLKNFITGLGGKDFKKEDALKIIKNFNKYNNLNFI